MDDDIESFLWFGRYEVAGDEVELFVGGCEGVLSARVARAQPRFANVIGHVEVMELVSYSGGFEDAPHPCSIGKRVRRKVQHHGDACVEQSGDMRPHRLPQANRAANIVTNRGHLIWIEA